MQTTRRGGTHRSCGRNPHPCHRHPDAIPLRTNWANSGRGTPRWAGWLRRIRSCSRSGGDERWPKTPSHHLQALDATTIL